ncbi:synaptic vesicle glycoprotein 2B-like [Armigeres subalbatus]|uniref:synaptic vesicle glycoprotein 2B-like n=1 Tax=Armigeres subalbatus TaxID=124917 RepID=UPI002ED57794
MSCILFPNLQQTVSYKMPPQLGVEISNSYIEQRNASEPKNGNNQTIKFDDALELIGFGRAQIEIVALCSVTIMSTICETMGISVILSASMCDIPMTTGNRGLVSGATFLGIVVSSYAWGYLSDTQGRKKMMQYGLYASAVLAVLSSFAPNFVTLLVLRLIAGICVSAPSATVYPYLGEFCRASSRAQMISFSSVTAMATMAYIALLGWWILSYDFALEMATNYYFKPWRLLFIVYTLPGLLAAVAFQFVPESPKFYLAVGKTERAQEVLQFCYLKNRKTLLGFAEYQLSPEPGNSDKKLGLLASIRYQTVPLLKWPVLLYFLVCCLQQMSAFAAYGGLGLWYPELMNQVTSSENDLSICAVIKGSGSTATIDTDEVCTGYVNDETFIYILIMAAFGTAFSIIISILLGWVNEKIMTVANLLVAAAAGIALLFTSNRYVMVVLFCTEVTIAGFTMVVINVTAVSIFPTHVRAMAVSLSMMMARLSSFTFSSVVGLIIKDQCEATFYMFSGILIVGALLVVFLPRKN